MIKSLRTFWHVARKTFSAMRSYRDLPVRRDQAAVLLHELHSQVRKTGYPAYLYGLLSAARTARAAGEERFTAIEFGVAGGNGLVAMERYAGVVEDRLGVRIDIVGFDTSSGLPPPTDPRDCPFAFQGGEHVMNPEKLRARLTRADLRLGNVSNTVGLFSKEQFSPVGFVSNDFDFYSSTRDSFALFALEAHRFLPRVTMYFDDLSGYPYSTVTGEWASIREFNAQSANRQLGQIYGLEHLVGTYHRFAVWPTRMFVLHFFDHPAYGNREVREISNLSLTG